MNFPATAGVVLAAGYGSLDGNTSKLVAPIGRNGSQCPMVCAPARLMRNGLGLPTTVVVNPLYRDSIKDALTGIIEPHDLVVQPDRFGTAHAVEITLQHLAARNGQSWRHLVVLYGDMPLWRTSTIQMLLEMHHDTRPTPAISHLHINLTESSLDTVRRFGRVLRDRSGRILAIREPHEMTAAEAAAVTMVNPSAWVFSVPWLSANLHRLQPHCKGDGYAAECWLPDLVALASEQEAPMLSIPLGDETEAVGVNNANEHAFAQRIMAERNFSFHL